MIKVKRHTAEQAQSFVLLFTRISLSLCVEDKPTEEKAEMNTNDRHLRSSKPNTAHQVPERRLLETTRKC